MALQTKTTHSHKKPIIITVIILALVLLGGYTAYAYSNHSWPFSATTSQPHNTDTKATHATPKVDKQQQSNNTSPDRTSNDPTNKTPPQYSPPKGGNSTPTNDLTGVINYKSVQDGALILRATINQQVSGGTCDLTLVNASTNKTVNRSANIIPRPSASTCDGFSVPLSDLGDGHWNVTIHLTSGNKHGTLTGDITIKT